MVNEGKSGAGGDKMCVSLLLLPLDSQVLGQDKKKKKENLESLHIWNPNILTMNACCLQTKHTSLFLTFPVFANWLEEKDFKARRKA